MAFLLEDRRPIVAAIVGVALGFTHQAATAQVRPQFEMADVRVNPTMNVNPNVQGVLRNGLYRVQNATMVDLIRTAYGIEADKVTGGPSWLELDKFNVLAKVPPSTSPDTARLMLQTLLADRFKLVLHRDSRPMPGFALTVGKSGTPKLKRAVAGSDSGGCRGSALYTDVELGARRQAALEAGERPVVLQTFVQACRNLTMTAFAAGMRNMIGAQQYFDTGIVVDQTGLGGEWDFELRYSQKPLSGGGGDNITIFDAIDKQLGLRLVATKIPMPVIVVDSVNRNPGDNPPGVSAILPPPPPAEFEVASIRLSDPNAPEVRSNGPLPGGRFEVQNFSLKQLVSLAWGLSGKQVKGEPDWLDSVRVNITAKLPSTEATREVVGVEDMNAFLPALKALLIERFKIVIRTEQQPGSGYALVAAKPRLQKADPTTRTKCIEGPGPNGKDPRISNPLLSRLVTCQNMTMQEFVRQIPIFSRGSIGGEVLDATGIKGSFDFTLSFSPNGTSVVPLGGLTLSDALEKQLGLKLEQRDIPVPVIVFDHIERKPTDN